jgi:hypothetical protein
MMDDPRLSAVTIQLVAKPGADAQVRIQLTAVTAKSCIEA